LTFWEAVYASVLLIKERSTVMMEGQVSMLNENCNSAASVFPEKCNKKAARIDMI